MARVGLGKALITPPLGTELCGYGVFLNRRATAVHDDLFARALLLEDDSGYRLLILSLDLLGLGRDIADTISKAAGAALGLDSGSVLVNCTHTHSGPATAHLLGWGAPDPAYVGSLVDCCEIAVAAALQTLQPARVGSAQGTVQALGFNRVTLNGPIDRSIHLVRIDDRRGTPRAVLFAHGCHPVTIDRRTPHGSQVSADWPGQVARRLEQEGYGEAIFHLGPCGDIDPVVAWHNLGFEGTALSAELVTQSLLALLRDVHMSDRMTLQCLRRTVRLPLVPLREEDVAATLAEVRTEYGSMRVAEDGVSDDAWPRFYAEWAVATRAGIASQPDVLEVSLAALWINDHAWLYIPGEIFSSLSESIRSASPFPHTVVTTLADHFLGYIPDRQDFEAGGYASYLAPRLLMLPPFRADVGEVLVTGALDLLRDLAGQTTESPVR